MISRMLTSAVVAVSIFLTGCSTTGSSLTDKSWVKCAAAGGAVWGIPGAVHSLATGGVSLAAGALVSGVACATADEHADNDVLPAPGVDGTTVSRFKINSSYLDRNSKAALDSFLEGKMDAKFTVIGHTCNLGSRDYNQTLSEKRANSVKSYLLKQGVSSANIKVVGKGETQPLYSNTSDENRKKNRRVEIMFQD